jgi:hypothetical protein
MAPWPMMVDYQEALQVPSIAFNDPELKSCKPQTTPIGLPFIRAGQFAGVCKFTNGRQYAVRFFFLKQDDRERRYKVISDYLADWRSRHKDSPIVGFAYIENGIRVGKSWYPVLKMDWVNGETLFRWIARQVQQREVRSIRALADRWISTVETLQAGQIVHGSLDHNNILVNEGQIILVDYDAIGVPGLFGSPNLENGSPAYQHPRRNGGVLAPNLDDFSAFVFLVALRSLAADLTLWTTFVEKTGNENILFTGEDLRETSNSALFRALLDSPDSNVATWAQTLMEWAQRPLDQGPRFSEIVHALSSNVVNRTGIQKLHTEGVEAMDAEIVAGLIRCLKDRDPAVRKKAARALGRIGIGTSVVVSELIAVLNDEDARVRGAASWALGEVRSGREM